MLLCWPRWLIQSPSATGCRTDLVGTCAAPFWPLEDVRGGIAFGERRESIGPKAGCASVRDGMNNVCSSQALLFFLPVAKSLEYGEARNELYEIGR